MKSSEFEVLQVFASETDGERKENLTGLLSVFIRNFQEKDRNAKDEPFIT